MTTPSTSPPHPDSSAVELCDSIFEYRKRVHQPADQTPRQIRLRTIEVHHGDGDVGIYDGEGTFLACEEGRDEAMREAEFAITAYRHGATDPGLLNEAAFWEADQLHQASRSAYLDPAGRQIADPRTTPATYPDVPLGAWQIHADFRGLYELESGALSVVNGHRRVAAAKIVRQTIRAWISWAVDTDKLDCQGQPIKTGLTYELAHKMVQELDFTCQAR